MEAPQQGRACRRPVRAGPAGGPPVTGRCDDPGRADQDWPPGTQRGAGLTVGPQPGVKRGEPARPAALRCLVTTRDHGKATDARSMRRTSEQPPPGQRHRMLESHPLHAQPHPLADLTGPQLQDGTAKPSKVIDRTKRCRAHSCPAGASEPMRAVAAREMARRLPPGSDPATARSRASRIRPVILCLRALTLNIAYPCSASQPNGD